jgi:hypothetical protein
VSIRKNQKDHLFEIAEENPDTLQVLKMPESQDSLQFWTGHPTDNNFVDLNIFAKGFTEGVAYGVNNDYFTGRPKLLIQMAFVIKNVCLGQTRRGVLTVMSALRTWWRLFDMVDMTVTQSGHPVKPLEDVRQLTNIYCEFAHKAEMRTNVFSRVVSMFNEVLIFHGAPELYWNPPCQKKIKRFLPPDDQVKILRIKLKQAWANVRRNWDIVQKVRADGFEPSSAEEAKHLLYWRYVNDAKDKYDIDFPSLDHIRRLYPDSSINNIVEVRRSVYPDVWGVDTAFHMCLAGTGWNPSTLLSLNAYRETLFLRNHASDVNRYVLTGTKGRSQGKPQSVIGLWKTSWGPGSIIRYVLHRVKPLRIILERQLATEVAKLKSMLLANPSYVKLVKQKKLIDRLQKGCRSVWLYLGERGRISWLTEGNAIHRFNKRSLLYMNIFIKKLNLNRLASGEELLAPVTASDFRDIFSLYVWRQSNGNILTLKRVLNHALIKTTQIYCDNNILNAERDQQVRSFVQNLFCELGRGRLDITILAHLQRYGEMTPEMESTLKSFRSLQLSRVGVGCKDPTHPPPEIEIISNHKGRCGSQRCLMCKKNSVILPESLDGIAMRFEELKVIQTMVSLESWLASDFPQEISNAISILSLFPISEVNEASDRWSKLIMRGMHVIPGLGLMGTPGEKNESFDF